MISVERKQPILTEEECVGLSFRASEVSVSEFLKSLTPNELMEINLNWMSVAHFWVMSQSMWQLETTGLCE